MLNNPSRATLKERSFYVAERDIKLKQNTEDYLANTGNLVWDGAIIFSKYLHLGLGHQTLKGKKVLELGSGTGLVGLAAAILGATTFATDLDLMLPLLKENVQHNDPHRELDITVCELQWGNKDHLKEMEKKGPWDYIIASEVVYDESFFEPLLATLAFLATKSTTILLAYTHRHPKEEAFWIECNKKFTSSEIDLSQHLPEDYQVPNFHIFTLTIKDASY